jgi:hypothetical protein
MIPCWITGTWLCNRIDEWHCVRTGSSHLLVLLPCAEIRHHSPCQSHSRAAPSRTPTDTGAERYTHIAMRRHTSLSYQEPLYPTHFDIDAEPIGVFPKPTTSTSEKHVRFCRHLPTHCTFSAGSNVKCAAVCAKYPTRKSQKICMSVH